MAMAGFCAVSCAIIGEDFAGQSGRVRKSGAGFREGREPDPGRLYEARWAGKR